MENKKISVVVPAYNEEKNLEILYEKLKSVLDNLKCEYEIIFVDDGSTDKTFEVLEKLHKKDKGVKVIQFRKNFGKSAALSAGFRYCTGDIVITMDGDLQDDPSEIPKFIEKLKEFDVVSGWRYNRKDPITKKLPSKFFNWLAAHITGVKIHDFNCGFKAYKKEVIKEINLYGELHRYIPALASWKGFRVCEIKVAHHPRLHGKSKYGAGRLIKGFLDLITVKFLTTYLNRPLHFFGVFGILSTFFGLLLGLYLIYIWLLGYGIGNRPLLVLAVLLTILGIQFISTGLIGELIITLNKNVKHIEARILRVLANT